MERGRQELEDPRNAHDEEQFDAQQQPIFQDFDFLFVGLAEAPPQHPYGPAVVDDVEAEQDGHGTVEVDELGFSCCNDDELVGVFENEVEVLLNQHLVSPKPGWMSENGIEWAIRRMMRRMTGPPQPKPW